jgi:hypothetical protein
MVSEERLGGDELRALTDPTLWLEHRVLEALRARTGTGRPIVVVRYGKPYYGRTAQKWGYSFCFEHRCPQFGYAQRFLMLSRTHVADEELLARETKPSIEQLAHELKNEVKEIPRDKFGIYHKELDIPGTYATIECFGEKGRYYFMVSESGLMEPHNGFKRFFSGL